MATNTQPSCLHSDTYLESLPFLEDIRLGCINQWGHSSFAQWLAKWPSFRVWSVLGLRGCRACSLLGPRPGLLGWGEAAPALRPDITGLGILQMPECWGLAHGHALRRGG